MQTRYYSFDVFDTCLARLCGAPNNLFEVLSNKVVSRMDDVDSEHMRQLFVAVRAMCGGNSLQEIYKHVAEQFPIPCTIAEMVQLELDTESDMLVPIAATRQLISSLREKGSILFVSDMYLPEDFIRAQLVRHGFFRDGDRLYVSNSVGACKYDGGLFRLIHEREGIAYRGWHHYGDNRKSDYTIPRRLGICAHHLHYDYLYYEQQWQQQYSLHYQYGSILAGVSRAVRLQSEASSDQAAYVCDIVAPFAIAWVLSVLQDARKRGIRRLYFLARDVHSEYLVALHFHCLFPEIEIRYLFLSRRALYNDNRVECYLQSEGFFDHTPTAIVDSCSSGRTLLELNRLCEIHHCPSVYGFFIAKSLDIPQKNIGTYLFNDDYLSTMTPKRIHGIIGMKISMFELLISLNYHNTIVGYTFHGNRIRPEFCRDEIDRWHFDNMTCRLAKRNGDQMLLTFADAFVRTGLSTWNTMVMERLAVPSLIDFVDRPRHTYLEYLHHFIYWDRPFVGLPYGTRKGVWKRGSRSYFFPPWLVGVYYALLSSSVFRKKINQFVSWIPLRKHIRK